MMKKLVYGIAAFCMIVSFASCNRASGSAGEGDTIKLGLYGPLSGPSATLGTSAKDAAELAVEQINAAGGLLGKRLQLITYDDMSSPEQAVKNVTRLIERDQVHGLIGSLHSGNIKATGELVEKAKIPEVGTGIAPDWLHQGWTYLFRSLANTECSNTSLLQKCNELGLTKIAIFHSLDEYAKDTATNMEGLIPNYGLTLAAVESFNPGDTDFTGQMSKIAIANPDAVFIAAVQNDMGNIIKQLRLNGYTGYVLGDIAMGNAEVYDIAGAATDKCVFSAQYVIPATAEEETNPILKSFYQAWVTKYKSMPPSDVALRTYDAVLVFAEGVRQANSDDGTAIRDAIFTINGFEGLGGVFNYTDKTGEGMYSQRVYVIENGKSRVM